MSVSNQVNHNAYWLNRSYLPDDIKKKVEPYLLPYSHPAREQLDHIYTDTEAPNEQKKHPISYSRHVDVFTYPELQKLALVIKQHAFGAKHKDLLRRVEAHKVAGQLIEEKKISSVKIPHNWLYPLPNTHTDMLTSLTHHVCRPIRFVLNLFSLKSPRWLKYTDSILAKRFIIVEEFVDIQFPNLSQIKEISVKISDEWKIVFEAIGFQDAHEGNFSLEDDGTITLFDLDQYSHKSEKNRHNGTIGIEILFGERYS